MSENWLNDLIIVDRTTDCHSEVWYSFAIDELLTKQVESINKTVCHLWTHPSAVILGQGDARLPHSLAAMQTLEAKGFKTCIRHSGGAAVPLDSNVLNISLIFPKQALSAHNYNDGFERMYQLIAAICEKKSLYIDKGEITGAYCPGDYDLSVNGFKFCGIAQRRKVNAYIVQAFINIDGDSVARGQLIKDFYDEAVRAWKQINKESSEPSYPIVNPITMSSLSRFVSFKNENEHSEVRAFIDILSSLASPKSNVITLPCDEEIQKQVNRLRKRYSVNH